MAALRDPTNLISNTVLFFSPLIFSFAPKKEAALPTWTLPPIYRTTLNTATYLPNYTASHHTRSLSLNNISCLTATSTHCRTYSDHTTYHRHINTLQDLQWPHNLPPPHQHTAGLSDHTTYRRHINTLQDLVTTQLTAATSTHCRT